MLPTVIHIQAFVSVFTTSLHEHIHPVATDCALGPEASDRASRGTRERSVFAQRQLVQ